MSSRAGPRAAGTDGTDFKHRQRVAAHYQYSVTYKFYLKCLFSLHLTVLIAMWAKILAEHLVREWGFKWAKLERLNLPAAYPWEYVWCLGIVSIVLGMLAMPKNKEKLMKWCYYSQFVTGVLPVAMGLGGQFPEFVAYVRDPNNSNTPTFRGTFPMVIIWYIFFVVALQIHGFSMYCAYQLVATWQPVTARATPEKDKKNE